MPIDSERQSDILLMLFAVQFTLLILLVPWLWPLLLFPVLLTLHVMKSEYHRRLTEEELQ
ncbi:hypothetical protein SAMN05421752_11616 [Natronorubrum thiooxidans]|uniref:Uncharacterized protein n=1 Tax=Natronorubrum thiooxidans TaxID=308853 RepID=A0A1N7GVN9_9EURY|nr:hypothetical protein SAMN05421752_11616 [Natronorubrum thiooxidans]